ncbi:MAG: DNA mismatch repair endonuclease MutL [Firmicutes bacterium]|nr:DNA mismatch repair endonuclease MutL [Bacillota bacterium]
MSEIIVLDSLIFNRIAAGEVVDSPASIVKELVENSIDAGAKNIAIKIEQGGIKRISITDNGKGLMKDDLKKAFLPHATSKIKSLNDLNAIKTLGFRGEALASIASVSKVTMISRRLDCDTGYFVVYENGILLECGEKPSPYGTTVIVEDLFKNVPARAKFLKKPSSEASAITDLVQKITLANVTVSFKYTNEEKCVLHSQGDGLNKAIYAVYGDVLNDLNEVSFVSPDIKISGYTSKIGYFKHNRNYQVFVVNGRVVECSDLSYYMFILYKDFLMTRSYPMFVIHIEVPFDTIDVNVHPNKMQVKFSAFDKVKYALGNAVKPTFKNELFLQDDENIFETVTSDVLRGEIAGNDALVVRQSLNTNQPYVRESIILREPTVGAAICRLSQNINQSPLRDVKDLCAMEENQSSYFIDIKQKPKIIGKLFSTYLIIEHYNTVYFIDQHASHERILFDEFLNNYITNSIVIQDLLVPFVFEISHTMRDILYELLPKFEKSGFRISLVSDNLFSLSSVPGLFSSMPLKEFIDTLITSLKSGDIKSEDFIKEKIAMSACRAAVKGNTELTQSEIEKLLGLLEKHDGVMLCPHGRPCLIKHSKADLEKWFKRKV